jgi:site-specific recombinase XerD
MSEDRAADLERAQGTVDGDGGRDGGRTAPRARMEALLLAEAAEHAHASRAGNTHRAYASDWGQFTAWCAEARRTALPASPRTVVMYLTVHAQRLKVSTLQRRLSAISACHKAAGHPTPTADPGVRQVWRGIVRTHGRRPQEATPTGTDTVRQVLAVLDDSIGGLRDKALLLLAYAGAFRRSELVALDVADVEEVEEGLIATILRSKTDQEGRGRRIGIPRGEHPETCPVRAYRAWLHAAGIVDGPVFRPIDRHGNVKPDRLRAQAVSIVLKRGAERAGLDPELFSSHSLRSGHVIQAARHGVAEEVIMAQTGHRSVTMPRRYIREGTLFSENSAASLGL